MHIDIFITSRRIILHIFGEDKRHDYGRDDELPGLAPHAGTERVGPVLALRLRLSLRACLLVCCSYFLIAGEVDPPSSSCWKSNRFFSTTHLAQDRDKQQTGGEAEGGEEFHFLKISSVGSQGR